MEVPLNAANVEILIKVYDKESIINDDLTIRNDATAEIREEKHSSILIKPERN